MWPLTSCPSLDLHWLSYSERGLLSCIFSSWKPLDMDFLNLIRPSINPWKIHPHRTSSTQPALQSMLAFTPVSLPAYLISPVTGPSPLTLELISHRKPRRLPCPCIHAAHLPTWQHCDYSHLSEKNTSLTVSLAWREEIRIHLLDFSDDPVVRNQPAKAGNMGSIPGPGRILMPWDN